MAKNDPVFTNQENSSLLLNQAGQLARSRSEKEASSWIHSPANLHLLKQGERLLGSLGISPGVALKQVDYLRAAWEKGTEIIYLFPTHENDPDAIEVTRKGKRVSCNLNGPLSEWHLTLAVNTKSRFRMTVAEVKGLNRSVVKIDLSKPIETRSTAKKKSSHPNPATESAAGDQGEADES